jgi:hypothetical protein
VASLSRLKVALIVGSIWLFPSCALESGGDMSDAESQTDGADVQVDHKGDAVTSNAIDSAAE